MRNSGDTRECVAAGALVLFYNFLLWFSPKRASTELIRRRSTIYI